VTSYEPLKLERIFGSKGMIKRFAKYLIRIITLEEDAMAGHAECMGKMCIESFGKKT
jgi:hypothetical protein